MKNLMAIVIFVVAIFSVSAAMGGDPLPYPDVGGGDSGGKVKVKVKEGSSGGETSSSSSGTTKTTTSTGGKTRYSTSSSDVKVEGAPVSTTGNPSSGGNN